MRRFFQRPKVQGIIYAGEEERLCVDKHRLDLAADDPIHSLHARTLPLVNFIRSRLCTELISSWQAATRQSVEKINTHEITPVSRKAI